jgi:hypothetical protein
MDHQVRPAGLAAFLDHLGDVSAGPQPVLGGQHAQALRLERPLRRRADKIARPARVRMRNRNPWVLARRRLFGWKVRFVTTSLRSASHSLVEQA